MALDLYIFYSYFRDLNLKLFQVMNMSEFYSDFLYRYQTEAAPLNVSIDSFCLREGVEYRNFIRWYRDNKKRLRGLIFVLVLSKWLELRHWLLQ